MKVTFLDENNFIVYAKDEKIEFDDKDKIENYFINLFSKIRNCYEIDFQGYYDTKIYYDDFYGSIIEVNKEDLEYFDVYGGSVDMRASLPIKKDFYYQMEDPFWIPEFLKKKICLYYNDCFYYAKIIEPLTQIEWGILLEHSIILYKEISSLKLKKIEIS